MNKEQLIESIIQRLNDFKKQWSKEFNPADLDVEGDELTFSIAQCIDDENGRSKELLKGNYYEIAVRDAFCFKIKGLTQWYPIKFFSDVEYVSIKCIRDYYIKNNSL